MWTSMDMDAHPDAIMYGNVIASFRDEAGVTRRAGREQLLSDDEVSRMNEQEQRELALEALLGDFKPIACPKSPTHNILIQIGSGEVRVEIIGCHLDYSGRTFPDGECADPSVGPMECAGPGTQHQGLIVDDQVWSPEGSPHWIVGDVYVTTRGRLKVKPGCMLVFTPAN